MRRSFGQKRCWRFALLTLTFQPPKCSGAILDGPSTNILVYIWSKSDHFGGRWMVNKDEYKITDWLTDAKTQWPTCVATINSREIFILYLAPAQGLTPHPRNFARMFDTVKLEWLGYRMAKKLWRCVKPFQYNTGTWRTDRRTDGDRIPISIARASNG